MKKTFEENEQVVSDLKPWVYEEEIQNHEIVDLKLDELEPSNSDSEDVQITVPTQEGEIEAQPTVQEKMPLPKYFQDLFDEFSTLEEFDLKTIVYDKNE